MKNSPQSQVFGFQGSTALITGASRGIGAATAKTLARYGANVVLLARSDSRVEELARGIRDSGGQALAHVGDVSVYEDMVRVVEAAREAFGTLDILVNNAGVIDPIEPIVSADAAAWAQTLDINVKGVFYGTRAALPGMLERGQGTIVNMSSGAANSALEGWSHYCVAKSAVQKFTECTFKEVSSRGVRVIGLSPGTVATDMMKMIRDSGINPVSKLDWNSHASAEWVADAIAFLCTDAAREFDGTDFSAKTEVGRALVHAFRSTQAAP